MMRSALTAIEAHSETTVMVGDRMDTDVIAGMEAGLRTILVLTGRQGRREGPIPVPAYPGGDSILDVVPLVGGFCPGRADRDHRRRSGPRILGRNPFPQSGLDR